MENLRAYMIINALKECELEFRYYPENMESNPDTCATIIEDGFYLAFESEEMAAHKAISALTNWLPFRRLCLNQNRLLYPLRLLARLPDRPVHRSRRKLPSLRPSRLRPCRERPPSRT